MSALVILEITVATQRFKKFLSLVREEIHFYYCDQNKEMMVVDA